MKRRIKPVLWTVFGLVLAFPLFSLAYYTMVRTSTPEFCATCHEIQPAAAAWRSSTHTRNAQGLVADCMDCHLPAPQDTANFFFMKTLHGAKDVAMHVLEGADAYDRAAMRRQAWASIKNDQCLKCHRNLAANPYNRGAMLAHRSVLYAASGEERRCTDCHRHLVHVDREIYDYRERGAPYRAQGLASLSVARGPGNEERE
jgi:cytochrome c-type protein NapC/trimethylamine-N-oxide reductase cytochrome c-type subunit TorC